MLSYTTTYYIILTERELEGKKRRRQGKTQVLLFLQEKGYKIIVTSNNPAVFWKQDFHIICLKSNYIQISPPHPKIKDLRAPTLRLTMLPTSRGHHVLPIS